MIAVVFWGFKSFVIRRMLIGFLCGADLFDGWSNHTKIASTSLSTLTIFFTGFFSYFLRVWSYGVGDDKQELPKNQHFIPLYARPSCLFIDSSVVFHTLQRKMSCFELIGAVINHFSFRPPLVHRCWRNWRTSNKRKKRNGDATLNKNNPTSRSTIRLIIPDCSMTRKEELVVVGGFESNEIVGPAHRYLFWLLVICVLILIFVSFWKFKKKKNDHPSDFFLKFFVIFETAEATHGPCSLSDLLSVTRLTTWPIRSTNGSTVASKTATALRLERFSFKSFSPTLLDVTRLFYLNFLSFSRYPFDCYCCQTGWKSLFCLSRLSCFTGMLCKWCRIEPLGNEEKIFHCCCSLEN